MTRVTNNKHIEIRITDLRYGWKGSAIYVTPEEAASVQKMLQEDRYWDHKGEVNTQKISKLLKKILC